VGLQRHARREDFPATSRPILHLMGGHVGDFRDWAAIDDWCDDVAGSLGGPAAEGAPKGGGSGVSVE